MNLFVNGILPGIQTIVARLCESKGRPRLFYEELEQYAQDEGESHLARIASLRVAKRVNKIPHKQVVHFTKQSYKNERCIVDDDQVYITEDDPILNHGAPSEGSTDASPLTRRAVLIEF